MPVYRLKRESGPDHSKRFLVEVLLKNDSSEPGRPLALGTGRTKKDAEQDAARRALSQLAAGSGGPAGTESSLPGAQKEEPATR
jgi:ribonuclease-3